jgi:type VI secretion system protein ImpH
MNERDTSAQDEAALQDLLAAVQARPHDFDFYALLRRIDVLRAQQPRTGEALRPRQEALRLGQAPELDFAAAPLQALTTAPGQPPRLLVRFFGLLGPMGPMPLHFTEFVRERSRHHDDATLAHFLDLFHHRMLSLFYRAWAQTQPVVQMDRPRHDRFRVWLGALAGAAPAAAQGSALPPALLAHHAGWLASRSAHPEMLSKVLAQVLGVAVRVEEHVGHWMRIERADRSRLGFARSRAERSAESTMGAAAQLGTSANAGHQVWDRQYRFRLHIGPLPRDTFDSLLPGGAAWQALVQLVQLVAGRDKTWDLALVLHEAHRPPPRLQGALRLGVSSWLAPPQRPLRGTPVRALHLRPLTSFLTRNKTPAPTGAAHA